MSWKHMDDRRETDRRDLTPEEQATIEDVLDAAQAFADGDVPFYEAASIGTLTDWKGIVSPSYTRYVALVRTPKNDPRTKALRQLLDTLVEAEGWVVTRQGVFGRWEIHENNEGWKFANLEKDAA